MLTDEQLTLSYVDLMDDYKARQTELQAIYNFHCTCNRCEDELMVPYFEFASPCADIRVAQQRNVPALFGL